MLFLSKKYQLNRYWLYIRFKTVNQSHFIVKKMSKIYVMYLKLVLEINYFNLVYGSFY